MLAIYTGKGVAPEVNIREHISEFFHNSLLIKWIQQNKIYKNLQAWPGIEYSMIA